jgi:hypothetical protein
VTDDDLDGVDFEAPSSLLARQALETGDTKEKLLKFGRLITGSEAEAEDLLADAFYVVCSPKTGRPWDPTRGPFSVHMRMVMKDMARRERRSSRARREVTEDGLAIDERTANPRDRADDALDKARALAIGETGMGSHIHGNVENTLPMMAGQGPFGPIEMGGMFTVVKVRSAGERAMYSNRVRNGEVMRAIRKPLDDTPEIDLSKARVLGRGLHAKRGVRLPLRVMREAAHKTQADVARVLDTDQSEISRIERRPDVMLSTLRKYAHAIGAECEVAFLFPKTGHRILLADPE